MIIKSLSVIEELNKVRKCAINTFHEIIPVSRFLVALSIIDDMILKIIDNDIKNILDNLHDLRDNILYMISFERDIKEGEKQ